MLINDLAPTAFEKIIVKQRGFSPLLRSILSGTSRSSRLSNHPANGFEKVIVEIASGVISPVVFLYVWWVLTQASSRGVRRLYFMARDGQVLKKVADVLINEWSLDIESRYLYCSRESLLYPSFSKVDAFSQSWIFWGYRNQISMEEVCKRLHLSLYEIEPFLKSLDLGSLAKDPNKPVNGDELERLKVILSDNFFVEILYEKARALRVDTLEYLKHEGVTDGTKIALVDTGWYASSQYALSSILKEAGKYPNDGIEGYYLGLNQKAWIFENDHLAAFAFDRRRYRHQAIKINLICLEMLFSADHGRTMGYRKEGDQMAPILSAGPPQLMASYTSVHHTLAVEYAKKVSSLINYENLNILPSAQLCRRLSWEFTRLPSAEVAEVYGEYPMACEICESDFQPTAPPMTVLGFVLCSVGLEKIRGYWPQASLIRGGAKWLCFVFNLFTSLNLLNWYRRVFLRY